MRPHIDPRPTLSLFAINRTANHPYKLSELRAAREEAKASVSRTEDRNYFRARAEEHSRLAAQAENPAARGVHLEFAERYYERCLETDDGSWANESGSDNGSCALQAASRR